MDLSIPIPRIGNTVGSKYAKHSTSNSNTNTISLEDCLEAFSSDESMEKCGYTC